MTPNRWPELRFESWDASYGTLHLMTQVIGKIRMEQTPWINHSWHVPFYVVGKGLWSSPVSFGDREAEFTFNLRDHHLEVLTEAGDERTIGLVGQSVATFFQDVRSAMADLGLTTSIYPVPRELPEVTPFPADTQHAHYNPDFANHLRISMLRMLPVFQAFRARFTGKVSPIHFFWGSFDLAVTRFSGRPAPLHPGGAPNCPAWVMQEAYSQELSSAGFYPGGGPIADPFFYSYAYPAPADFRLAPIPEGAFFSDSLGEFVLPYDVVRRHPRPEDLLMGFFQATFDAASRLAKWDATLDGFHDPRIDHPSRASIPLAG